MNVIGKRFIALLLSSSLIVGFTSCRKVEYGDKILTCAGFISEYTVERKYADIVNMAMQPSPELRECLAMSTDSATEFRPQLAIESTLKYDVQEDTLECFAADQTGTVDVVFTYCDYEEVMAEYPIFVTMEDFEQAIADCKDEIEITLTFEFKYVDGIVKLVNIDDLTQLFPYKDIVVPLSLGYSAYVDDPEFMGSEFDPQYQCYRDTDCIIANIPITGDGNKLIWDYYYEITRGFDVVYTSPDQHEEYPNILYMDFENGESLPNGFYNISFYDLEGVKFTEFTIYVIGNVNPVRYIGSTSLSYELPEGCAYADPNVVDMTDRFGAYEFAIEVYVTSVNPDTYGFGYDLIIEDDYYVYSEQSINDYFNNMDQYMYERFEEGNPTLHQVNFSFDVPGCDVHYVTYFVDNEGNYYDLYCFEALFVYEGETIRIYITTDNFDDISYLLSGLRF